MRAPAAAAALGLAVALAPGGPAAQEAPAPDAAGPVQSPVLTIDAERLFAETLFGRRVNAELVARSDALQSENERLAAELAARERGLTERRPTMEPEAFRAAADAFDADVQRIRAEQDAKEVALQQTLDAERQRFLGVVTPVLARLMIESGAAVILERRYVFLGVGLVDVTDEAIGAIDAALGDGSEGQGPAPAEPAEEAPPPASGDGGG